MYCRSVFVLPCSTLSFVQNRKFPLFEPIFDECGNKAVFVLKGLKNPVTMRVFGVMKLTDADSKQLKSGQRITHSKSVVPHGTVVRIPPAPLPRRHRLCIVRDDFFIKSHQPTHAVVPPHPKKFYNFSGTPLSSNHAGCGFLFFCAHLKNHPHFDCSFQKFGKNSFCVIPLCFPSMMLPICL